MAHFYPIPLIILLVLHLSLFPDHVLAGDSLYTDFMGGVNHAHIHRRGSGYGSQQSIQQLKYLRDIGITWIALTPFGYQEHATDDTISGFSHPGDTPARRDRSLTDEDLIAEIEHVHELGLQVVLKPHLWSRDFWGGEQWHGTVRQVSPEQHRSWWKAYTRFIVHYAKIAQRTNVEVLVIGNELVSMTGEYPEEWKDLIPSLRKIYTGKITYAAHWDTEFQKIRFWGLLDMIGINAYYPLDAPANADIDTLIAAWAPHKKKIKKLADRYDLPVIFLEIGYRTVQSSWQEPWHYTGGKKDLQAQAKAYEALLKSFSPEPWWQGVFFWKTFTDREKAESRDNGKSFRFLGKPAEDVLRRWFVTE